MRGKRKTPCCGLELSKSTSYVGESLEDKKAQSPYFSYFRVRISHAPLFVVIAGLIYSLTVAVLIPLSNDLLQISASHVHGS